MNPPLLRELLPHAGDMVLLDELLSCDAESLSARAVVRPCPFSLPDGSLPPWLGLEMLAQGVGAWAGWHARQAGTPVKLGFLLGTRHYACHAAGFPAGAVLTIAIRRAMQDATGMGVFECELRQDETVLAQARLNVYQPADAAHYTQEPAPHE
ncbi:hypothetical protein PIGHUM_03461 [Pigmentiphaga humi]|uniref:(3R)-hydroxymyristoyl-ACP dehydratase n=1 Tax=Pigmentiphaga humi TaxID=2478468 RepID=A0A3P4B6T9_9BURK|nr:hotdog family protein [Pigmentiphaga humi]VCU71378.1 hypothetical protein PIGHUM_03461 [Pigmentiphaga humi]